MKLAIFVGDGTYNPSHFTIRNSKINDESFFALKLTASTDGDSWPRLTNKLNRLIPSLSFSLYWSFDSYEHSWDFMVVLSSSAVYLIVPVYEYKIDSTEVLKFYSLPLFFLSSIKFNFWPNISQCNNEGVHHKTSRQNLVEYNHSCNVAFVERKTLNKTTTALHPTTFAPILDTKSMNVMRWSQFTTKACLLLLTEQRWISFKVSPASVLPYFCFDKLCFGSLKSKVSKYAEGLTLHFRTNGTIFFGNFFQNKKMEIEWNEGIRKRRTLS